MLALKSSARSSAASSSSSLWTQPLPLLLDFLAPSWSHPSWPDLSPFFDPSFRHHQQSQAQDYSSHASTAEPSSSLNLHVYAKEYSVKRAGSVAWSGYTPANYGLASAEWSVTPSPRPWSVSMPLPMHMSMSSQRYITTLPTQRTDLQQQQQQPMGTQQLHQASQDTLDRLQHLQPHQAQLSDEREWTRLLKHFWKRSVWRDPTTSTRLAEALLNDGRLLDAWDILKVARRHLKNCDREPDTDMLRVLDQVHAASLAVPRLPQVDRVSDEDRKATFRSKRAWSKVSGLTFSPGQHRVLLRVSSFDKAFFAFKWLWPPFRSLYDYERMISAACEAENHAALQYLWADLQAHESFRPTWQTYHVLINYFKDRRDAETIELLIQSMRSEGQKVTRADYTNLMQAYVALADWPSVSRVFKHMENSPLQRERPDLAAVNVVLRAEMLAGAPWRLIRDLVASLPSRGYKPDSTTMAILMESAVDLDLLSPAEAIFAQMDRSPAEDLKPNVIHFGIMIKAFLVRRDTEAAQQYLDEMFRRAVQPSAVIYAQIIQAYLYGDRAEASLQAAQNIAEEFHKVRSEKDVRFFNSIMVPFIASFARSFQPQPALQYFKQIFELQGTPSHVAYTTLLDSYKRVGDVAAMRAVWSNLYEQALGQTAGLQSRSKQQQKQRIGRANFLCLPLSAMMQGLAAAGQYISISEIWQQMHKDGFGFDCSNWNHLVQILVNAGDWETALVIAERVLLTWTDLDSGKHVMEARRVRPDPEAPSRSHQERAQERKFEQLHGQGSRPVFSSDKAAEVKAEPFLSAFEDVGQRVFWGMQKPTKKVIYSDWTAKMAHASSEQQRVWEDRFPRVRRAMAAYEQQVQEESEQASSSFSSQPSS